MDPAVVRAVAELAARQHGALSVAQLRELRVSAKAQRRAVGAGWLVPAAPGVVVLGGSPPGWERDLRVGLLSLGPAAWASHEAAAHLHRLDRSRPVAEFSVPRAGRRSQRVEDLPGPVHTTARMGPLDVVTVGDLRCASATRTILDLAAIGIPDVRLEAAIDSAVRLGLSAPAAIAARLAELRVDGCRGARTLDRLLVDAGVESRLEREFLRLVRRAGLPRPVTQRVFRRDGRHVARVDFLFPDAGVVIEVTGRVGHSSPADRQRDAQRRNELLDLGLRVYEYTWADVTARPAHVLATLRARIEVAVVSPNGLDSAT